jgi:hypothetical protein
MHEREQIRRNRERQDAERNTARQDAQAAAVLALQHSAGNRAVAGALARFRDNRFDTQPKPTINFGVDIEEMTETEVTDLDAMLARGDVIATDNELKRLADRAHSLQRIDIGARIESHRMKPRGPRELK